MKTSDSYLPPHVLAAVRSLPSPNLKSDPDAQAPQGTARRLPSLHSVIYAQQLGWAPVDVNALMQEEIRCQLAATGHPEVQVPAAQTQACHAAPCAGMQGAGPHAQQQQQCAQHAHAHHPQHPQHPPVAPHSSHASLLAAYQTYPNSPATLHTIQQQLGLQQQEQQQQGGIQESAPPERCSEMPIPYANRRDDPFVYVNPPAELSETIRVREQALFRVPPIRQRMRVAQACEGCRKRKGKCSGEKPNCKRCRKRCLDCVYVEDHRANKDKKRAIAAEMPKMPVEKIVAIGDRDARYAYGALDQPRPPVAGPSNSSCSSISASSERSYYSSADSSSDDSIPLSTLVQLKREAERYAQIGATTNFSDSASAVNQMPTVMVDGRPIARARAPVPAFGPASSNSAASLPNSNSSRNHASHSSSLVAQYTGQPQPPYQLQDFLSYDTSQLPRPPAPHDVASVHNMHGAPHAGTFDLSKTRPMSCSSAVPHVPVHAPYPTTLECQLEQRLAALVRDTGKWLSTGPPALSRDGSSSSSGSGSCSGPPSSGIQTPAEYYCLAGARASPPMDSLPPPISSKSRVNVYADCDARFGSPRDPLAVVGSSESIATNCLSTCPSEEELMMQYIHSSSYSSLAS